MRKLFVLGVALAMAGTAYAAPNIAQNTQKGSVLIAPDIDVRGQVQTIVRLSNDGPRDVQVKCYYLDGYKHRVDMQFELTANQPFWFDAKTGDGTEFVTPYPNTPSNGFPNRPTPLGAGMLACWVVDIEGLNQLKWNHLSGTVTVIDHKNGTAYEYTMYAFYAPTGSDLQPVGTGGVIDLDSVKFDSCPQYMIGQFSPIGTRLPGPEPVTFGLTRVAFAGCNIALNQDWVPTWTKLQYDVWNEEENKVTGTFECADTWHEMYLNASVAPPKWPDPTADAASSNFDVSAVGTAAARYRVQGIKSTQCNQYGTGSAVAVGVLAIQSTDLAVGGGLARIGTNLTASGKLPTGKIIWDPGFVTPEGGIR